MPSLHYHNEQKSSESPVGIIQSSHLYHDGWKSSKSTAGIIQSSLKLYVTGMLSQKQENQWVQKTWIENQGSQGVMNLTTQFMALWNSFVGGVPAQTQKTQSAVEHQ